MKKLYLVMHMLAKDRYHYSLQDEVGNPLAETRDFATADACRAIKDDLVGILKECAQGRSRKPSLFQCKQYYYHGIKQGNTFLLRTRTCTSLDDSKTLWNQLMQCVSGGIIDYEYLRGNIRKTLNLDPKVMNYMYSLDGMGYENILNYTFEVPWEHKDSWLYDPEKQQMSDLYRRLFHKMPRLHPKEYEITIQTGIWADAGTYGNVYLTFYGTQLTGNQTDSGELLINQYRPLTPGSRYVTCVRMKETLGILNKLRIRYENPSGRSDSSSWFLESIQIREVNSSIVRYYHHNEWISANANDDFHDFTIEGKFGADDRYEVTFETDPLFSENEDSCVGLTLFGGKKKCSSNSLGAARRHYRNRKTNTFIVHASSKLDNLDKLQISVGSRRYVRKIVVRNTANNKRWSFRPDCRFLDPEHGTISSKTVVALPGDGEARAYAVHVKTGSRSNAGTDANVYITLHGEKSSSAEQKLVSPENQFQKGSIGLYRVASAADIGPLNSITIRHDNFGIASGWFLENVKIEDASNGDQWEFPCSRWLAKNEDDGSIQRTLDAVPEGCEAVTYSIQVRTGEVGLAGTDAKVYITLNGDLGSTGEHQLDSSANDFEKGRTNVFTITRAREVGELQSLRIRHDNSGLFPGWYLKDIRVTCVNDERVWYFPCDQWLKKDADNCLDLTLTPGVNPENKKEGGEDA